jgi:ATP-dependent Clp protease ATP-binding subunit ClpA
MPFRVAFLLIVFVGTIIIWIYFKWPVFAVAAIVGSLLAWAKHRHRDNFHLASWVAYRLPQFHVWLWILVLSWYLAGVVRAPLAGDYTSGAICLAIVLVLLAVPYYLIQKDPMSDYLKYLGQGGVDAVRANLDKTPAVAKLQVPANLAELVKAEVIGQDEAIDELCSSIIRRAQVRRPNKPIFVAMLVGATGAGKTETAKAVAKALGVELTRFDMNEFTEPHSAQRLIGAPPGYMDSDKGGQLTQAIKLRGAGVLLFDEIEKAHENIMKLLMGLLDEGRITEQSTGETMDASSFVIIATSNAEFAAIATIAENTSASEARNQQIKSALLKVWQPDKLSRFDAILAYKKLGFEAQIALVVRYLLKFAKEANVQIVEGGMDPGAIAESLRISQQTSTFGAREFQKALEREVLDSMLDLAHAGVKRVRIGIDAQGRIRAFDANQAHGVANG